MGIKAGRIFSCIEMTAPRNLAESWDNAGLQIGSYHQDVERVLTTLDVTKEVVEEAIEKKADLIVSHHPFIFNGLKHICYEEYRGDLVRTLIKHDIGVYSAHTNIDIAALGLSDHIAKVLNLKDIKPLGKTGDTENGFGKTGILSETMDSDAFLTHLKSCLNIEQMRTAGDIPEKIHRVAVCTGAGAEFMGLAKSVKADVYITGDLKYHDAQRALENHIWVIDAGHFGTEKMVADLLKKILEDAFSPEELTVYRSQVNRDYFQYV